MIVFDSLICKSGGTTYSYLDGVLTYRYTPSSTNYYIKGVLSLNTNGNQIEIKSANYGQPSSTSQQVEAMALDASQLNTVYNNLPNSIVATLRLTLSEYSDSAYNNQVGSSVYKEIKLSIPESVKPSINFTNISLTPSQVVINGDTYQYLIKGKTNLSLSVSGATAGEGSSIKSYTFSGPSVSQTSTTSSISVPAVTNVHEFVNGRATITYTVTVTDTRNRSASADKEITCYDYHNPYFESFNVSRTSGGTSLRCTYTPVFAPITNIFDNSINRANVQIYYTSGGTTRFETAQQVTNGQQVETVIGLESTTSTYQVYAVITDELDETGRTATKTIYGDSRIMNVFPDGSGVAFGQKATERELLDSKWPIRANGFLIPEMQHGSIVVPSNATSATVSFVYKFSGTPTVTLTQESSEAIVTNMGAHGINMEGFNIWLNKASNKEVTINWIAMY